MSKTKQSKTSKKSEVKSSLSKVKSAAVTKPSQTPVAKSKQIAKETAAKFSGSSQKPEKVVKKAATPSSDEDSSDASDSESEVETIKPIIKVNGKTNGKVASESSSGESDSDESDSSNDDSSDADSGDKMVVVPVAGKDESDSSDSSEDDDEDSDEEAEVEAPPAKAKIDDASAAAKAAEIVEAVSRLRPLILLASDANNRILKMRMTMRTAPLPLTAAMMKKKLPKTLKTLKTRATMRKRHLQRSVRLRMRQWLPQRNPRWRLLPKMDLETSLLET